MVLFRTNFVSKISTQNIKEAPWSILKFNSSTLQRTSAVLVSAVLDNRIQFLNQIQKLYYDMTSCFFFMILCYQQCMLTNFLGKKIPKLTLSNILSIFSHWNILNGNYTKWQFLGLKKYNKLFFVILTFFPHKKRRKKEKEREIANQFFL